MSGVPAGPRRLEGGFVNTVDLVEGDLLQRTGGPWSPACQLLLSHLQRAGFALAPKPRGLRGPDLEFVSFIPGESCSWSEAGVRTDSLNAVRNVAASLASYHSHVRSFGIPPTLTWRNPLLREDADLICHGDFWAGNVIWRGEEVEGIIDWDFARPGLAIQDLAHLAWNTVPVTTSDRRLAMGFDRNQSPYERLSALREGYGDFSAREILEWVKRGISREIEETEILAAEGMFPWTRFAADGNISVWRQDLLQAERLIENLS